MHSQRQKGVPFNAMAFASKGDAITDLVEDMAADGATSQEQQFCIITKNNYDIKLN